MAKTQTFTIQNQHGMRVQLTDLGATIMSVLTPDRHGQLAEITLGYDTVNDWLNDPFCLGSTCGRCANRIAGGSFSLDGKDYQLAVNNGPNHLHGGLRGFNQQIWQASQLQRDGATGVRFQLTSPDGDESYPGELIATADYWLTDDNQLIIEYSATTDAPTICNLVNHSYWNLSGQLDQPEVTIDDHQLEIPADHFIAVDSHGLSTGEAISVAGTALDFRQPKLIGQDVDSQETQIQLANGYDHCFLPKGQESSSPRPHATLYHPASGRQLELLSNQPGIHIYSGNFLEKETAGRHGIGLNRRRGVALETEQIPDAINHPQFPSPVLRPGEKYQHTMVLRFSVVD
ncbi:galactose mutarotase [Persicirhabdus sediminis]|uniref:Aldose 1-epimerase n=2 Tax=Persicirhabdus sediminis TaxID=454144 RepID=A0A8J7SKH2_9BACT|nr:galactose mutarotase [Persicirhabdus sediminis]